MRMIMAIAVILLASCDRQPTETPEAKERFESHTRALTSLEEKIVFWNSRSESERVASRCSLRDDYLNEREILLNGRMDFAQTSREAKARFDAQKICDQNAVR